MRHAEGVILLHGIGRTSRCMRPLARALERAGYRVLNLDYPSTRMDLSGIVEHIHPVVQAFAASLNGKACHWVGYSMGGLVARAYLAAYPIPNMGKVAMLGTPNGGSEVADCFHSHRWFRWIYGPAGQQLITDQSAFAHVLGEVGYPLGIIAGTWSIDPISSLFLLPGANDGKVTVARTQHPNMQAFAMVRVPHTLLPAARRVHRWVLGYFQI